MLGGGVRFVWNRIARGVAGSHAATCRTEQAARMNRRYLSVVASLAMSTKRKSVDEGPLHAEEPSRSARVQELQLIASEEFQRSCKVPPPKGGYHLTCPSSRRTLRTWAGQKLVICAVAVGWPGGAAIASSSSDEESIRFCPRLGRLKRRGSAIQHSCPPAIARR